MKALGWLFWEQEGGEGGREGEGERRRWRREGIMSGAVRELWKSVPAATATVLPQPAAWRHHRVVDMMK